MRSIGLISCIFFLLFLSCHPKWMNSSDISGDYLLALEGGGFAGLEYGYLLTDEGYMFSRSGIRDSLVYIGILPRRQTRQLFSNGRSTATERPVPESPGNRYRTLEIRLDGAITKGTWDPDKDSLPGSWTRLHQLIMRFGKELIKKDN